MPERLAFVPEATEKPKEITLRESLVGPKGKLSKDLTRVAKMLNHLELPIGQRRLLFFYHIWHETGSFAGIKDFIEIPEDPARVIVDPVLDSEKLTEEYSQFYKRYQATIKKGEPLKTSSISPSSKGIGQARLFEERLLELLPLRGKLTARQISASTGYSEDYIRSAFKRAIKRGLVEKLDKKELAKRLKEVKQ